MNGNLSMGLYTGAAEHMSDVDKASVLAGNYPIILAQNGVFTKKYITESEFVNYNHWDAMAGVIDEQWNLHGYAVPIVQECNEDGAVDTGMTEGAPPTNPNEQTV